VSERLNSLRQQRALARQQLDWFDREIAALEAATQSGAVAADSSVEPAGNNSALPIPDAFTPDPVATGQEVRRGCLLWAVAVVLVIGAALAAVFIFAYGDRPLFFMDRDR
jgi:hypothetical protein